MEVYNGSVVGIMFLVASTSLWLSLLPGTASVYVNLPSDPLSS